VLNILATISDRKAWFPSLGEAWADTTTVHGRSLLTIIATLAAWELGLIKARTGEGRARAKARDPSLGRPFKLTAHQRKKARGG